MTVNVGYVEELTVSNVITYYMAQQTANCLISTGYGCICVLIATGEQMESMAREEKNVI